jgi:GNAT superfamily N-acetyltransferase
MTTSQIDLIAFTPEHLDGALRLSRGASWPHRREDWEMVLSLSAGFVALDGEQVAGTAMITPYGKDEAAVNMIIVDPKLRGRGIGRRLMELALRETGDRSCRLIATPDGIPLYTSVGFRPVSGIAQHQGTLGRVAFGGGVAWAGPEAAAEVARLDREATGLDRSRLIAALFEQGSVARLARAGTSGGFAALRPFGKGEVAGPVVADSDEGALALLQFIFAARPGAFMRVDTPVERGLGPWLQEYGLAQVDTAVAMRRGGHAPAPGPINTYALASQALG